MFQKKTKQNFLFLTLILLSGFLLSCSPKAATTRAATKTTQQNLDAGVSAQSQQQAQTQGTNYLIKSVSRPIEINGGYEVKVEIQTPGNQFLPLTTQHVNGSLETNGNYYDSVRGLDVSVQAKCSNAACEKYVMLLTVSKAGQNLFQNGAISFHGDCSFYSVSIGSNVANLFANLAQFEGQWTLSPRNDCQGE